MGLSGFALLVSLAAASCHLAPPSSSHSLEPRTDNNLTSTVSWDPYSLSVFQKRIFLFSGEFHTWRLPSRSLWRDIMQKAAAGGLNGISLYTHWGIQEPSPGVLDFDGVRGVEAALQEAQAAGLWVTLRPGPYVNAETTGGGLPGWVTALNATLRTNDAVYTAAWQKYWTYIGQLTAKYQVTNGGPIILFQVENEFDNGATRAAYMQLLQDSLRRQGVVIPTTHNNKGERSYTYATGAGAVNIWGLDSYPGGGCSSTARWGSVVTDYNEYRNASGNPTIPLYMPEFKGGWFNPWGSTFGYDQCRAKVNDQFERVFYMALWAQNARLINLYMYYGGTNWGGLPAPVVYTSYDYGAAISENRAIGAKYYEAKLQGLFLRSAVDFRQTSFAPEVTTLTSSSLIATAAMRNWQTGACFYIVRHTTPSSTDTTPFTLDIVTSRGELTIPQTANALITLQGRDARTIVTDYRFGSTHILYSTASVLLSTTIEGSDWLVVYGGEGETFELALVGQRAGSSSGSSNVTAVRTNDTLLASFSIQASSTTLFKTDSTNVLILSRNVATTYWAPVIAKTAAFGTYAEIGSNDTVIVGGPSLVRTATIQRGSLSLTGDNNRTTTLVVFGPSSLSSVTWNGAQLTVARAPTGALTAVLQGPAEDALRFSPPVLSGWKFADSLPELSSTYSDAGWTVANKTITSLRMPAYPRAGPWLLGEQDYGFFVGNVLWRGRFVGTRRETAILLSINGGPAFAASVWLNGQWIGGVASRNSSDTDVINGTFAIPRGLVSVSSENVVTVLNSNTGLNENSGTGGLKQARGIVGYSIVGGGNFTEWRVQGNLGGNTAYPDKVRGSLNEGGLYGERAGWHLPGFNDAAWEARSPAAGLAKPGVGFFRTTFNLNVPRGHDAMMSFKISGGAFTRAQLYVNGWQMGRYAADLGPQDVFPVHEGILVYNGTNTVALSLWGVGNATADWSISDVQLQMDAVSRGGVGEVVVDNPAWADRGAV